MENMMAKVSIIIPYYNSENTIIRALDSVKNQTYRDFEIILVDDGSKDLSNKLVSKYICENYEMKILNLYQSNKGVSCARNYGIKSAKGEYIALLDSDDSWKKEKLEKQINFLEKHTNIYILGTDYSISLDNNIYVKSSKKDKFKEISFYRQLFKNYFLTPCVIIRKKALDELGGFNEEQRYAEDKLLFMRILRRYKGGIIESPLANLHKNEYGESGLSRDLKLCEKYEIRNFILLIREENKKLDFLLVILAISFSIIKYFRRMLIINIGTLRRR